MDNTEVAELSLRQHHLKASVRQLPRADRAFVNVFEDVGGLCQLPDASVSVAPAGIRAST